MTAGHACPALELCSPAVGWMAVHRRGCLWEVRDGVEVLLRNKHLTALKGWEEEGREKGEKRERRPRTCPLTFKSSLKKSRPGKGKEGEDRVGWRGGSSGDNVHWSKQSFRGLPFQPQRPHRSVPATGAREEQLQQQLTQHLMVPVHEL